MEIFDLEFVFWESENIQWTFKKNSYGIPKKQRNKIFVFEKGMWVIDSFYFFNRNDFKIYKLSCLVNSENNSAQIDSVKCVSDEFEYIDEEILFDFVQKEAEKMAGK